MSNPSHSLVIDGARPAQATLGRYLRSKAGWNLLVPFLVSLHLSVVPYTLVVLIATLFILGGMVLWAFSSTAESRAKAAAILTYGLAMAPAPTIFMVLALVTTRNQ